MFLAVRANFDPSQGPARLIFGFEAVIIGGLGSLWGTLAGGLILGVAQAIGAHLDPGWQILAGHIAFLVVLAVRPEGLFPKVRHERARRLRQPRSTGSAWRCCVVALVALAAAPFWGGRDDLALLSEIYAYVALASLWNLLAGYAGLVSVGQQAYVGLGAYVLFACAIIAGISPLLAIPLAGIISAVVAIPVGGTGVPAARPLLRDRHLDRRRGISSFGFQVTALGGGSGTSLPASVIIGLAPSRQMRDFLIYWIALALVVAILALIVLLLRSRYGLALKAIRDSELAATCNGIDVRRIKFLVYVVTAFGTAMVGALIFLQKLRVSPDAAFSVNDWTAFVIFITVIGGIGRIEGPIVGTIVFFLLRQTLADLGTIYLLMLGAVAILVMLWAPKGLWGLIVERFGWQVFPLERKVVLDQPSPPLE